MTHPTPTSGAGTIRQLGHDLLNLISPSLCPGCEELLPYERQICEACLFSMEMAPYPEEIFEDVLEGSLVDATLVESVGALYLFEQSRPIQGILHDMKYHGGRRIAHELGRETATTLALFPEFSSVDVVVPVPLHPARFRERGYNQAEEIGRGMAASFGATLRTDVLVRRRNTATQTRRNVADRRANVAGIFEVNKHQETDLREARLVICDDVITTGATLLSVAAMLGSFGCRTISGAAVAYDKLGQC